jgi:hypothetical protein
MTILLWLRINPRERRSMALVGHSDHSEHDLIDVVPSSFLDSLHPIGEPLARDQFASAHGEVGQFRDTSDSSREDVRNVGFRAAKNSRDFVDSQDAIVFLPFPALDTS